MRDRFQFSVITACIEFLWADSWSDCALPYFMHFFVAAISNLRSNPNPSPICVLWWIQEHRMFIKRDRIIRLARHNDSQLRIRAFYFSNHQLMCVSQTQKSQICQFRRDVYFGTLTIVRRGIGQSNTCYDSTRSRSCSEIMQKLKIILFIRDICRTVVSVCKETSKL